MQLRSQFEQSDIKKPAGHYVWLKATVATVAVVGTLIAVDASAASADKVDMLTGGLTALPSETLKVYSGLMKIVPAAAGAAAMLAAMRGGMGYVMGLVRSVIR